MSNNEELLSWLKLVQRSWGIGPEVEYECSTVRTGDAAMTHTPGPWTTQDYYAEKSDWFDICAEHAENGIIGSTYCQSYEQNRANAAMMAAAPDLYAALRDMLALYENAAPNAFDNGVTDPTGSVDEGAVWAGRFADAARAALAKAEVRS